MVWCFLCCFSILLVFICQLPVSSCYRIVRIRAGQPAQVPQLSSSSLPLPLAPINSLIRRRNQLNDQERGQSGAEEDYASNINAELRGLAAVTGVGEGEGAVYLLHNGVYRHIPHEDTWISFGFTNASSSSGSSECTREKEIHSWRTNHGPRAGLWLGRSVCIEGKL